MPWREIWHVFWRDEAAEQGNEGSSCVWGLSPWVGGGAFYHKQDEKVKDEGAGESKFGETLRVPSSTC